ncbi:MAG: hypothetical protein ACOX3T_06620 [Bdellovibrionota bacterium]
MKSAKISRTITGTITKTREAKRLTFLLLFLFSLATILTFSACGSSDDDDDSEYVGSAIIDTKVRPSTIDTSDRVQVAIDIYQIHENGILLKVRFEKALQYVPNSSFITAKQDNMREELIPLFVDDDPKYTYLIFFLSRSQFGEANEGKVFFELKGIRAQKDVKLEVDPDVDDPNIPNDVEFSIHKPEFTADTVSYITIR